MKSRFRVGMVLVALMAQLFAPLAAYASVTPTTGVDDFCSANRGAVPGPGPALPRPASPKHGSSHCAYCSGTASSAVLPGIVAPVVPTAELATLLPKPTRLSIATATVWLPPTRAPPGVS